ncbi:MAG TPA: AsmA family protein [Candidatus Acidoferrales bacterium]|nr:AsmA family protein [Candidatus Acidoferrales bacterium]
MAKKRKPLFIALIVIVVIFLILIITPFFIDADRFRPQIENALSGELGRKVEIGHLSVSLLSGSLKADEISIADDAAFSKEDFLTAKSLAIGIDVMPLILSRQLHVHSLDINDPQLQLLRTAAGQWNFSTLGGAAPANAKPAAATANDPPSDPPADPPATPATTTSMANSITVDSLKISGATVSLRRVGEAMSATNVYQNVNIAAQNISEASAFPFQFDAKTPTGGKLNLTGKVGPLGNGDANHLPFDGELKAHSVPAEDIENLLAVLGYALPSGSSLKGGTLEANLALRGPLEGFVSQGPVSLNNVTLAGYSLGSKLAGALGQSSAQTGNDTLVKVASSNVSYGPAGVRAESVNVEIPGIGDVTGSGTVSANNALDFHLIAKLEGSSPLAKLTQLPFFNQGGGIPFHVDGTTSDPHVTADIAGLNKTPLNQLKVPTKGQLGGMLGGLLKRKKPQ